MFSGDYTYKQLEGAYRDRETSLMGEGYTLWLNGPEISVYEYGKLFSLSKIFQGDDGGNSQSIEGPYKLDGDRIILTGTELLDREYNKTPETDKTVKKKYTGKPIIIKISTDKDGLIHLKLKAFDKTLDLRKQKDQK